MKYFYSLLLFISISSQFVHAQFPPQVGYEGTTAIHKDSSIFSNWATSCTVTRGYQNISNPTLGLASAGEASLVPGSIGSGLVSLGDGGSAIVEFEYPIYNGDGPDFAIFENGFLEKVGSDLAFLELGFVEVSSDGENFYRFPAVSNVNREQQLGGFAVMDARLIHNFAGKYIANYGTPFDLEDLKDIDGLDVNHITHIKIIDVVGSIDPVYGTYDSNDEIINDPYPTPFASGGFDLSGVGVIHQKIPTKTQENITHNISVYPNPAKDYLYVNIENITDNADLKIFHVNGQNVMKKNISSNTPVNISELKTGMYVGMIQLNNNTQYFKFTKE